MNGKLYTSFWSMFRQKEERKKPRSDNIVMEQSLY